MADPVTSGELPKPTEEALGGAQNRKEKRKALKKLKRKQIRTEAAIREREKEEARSNDPEEQLRIRLREQEETKAAERERKEFEERERLWLEAAAKRKAEEEERRKQELLEKPERRKGQNADELEEDDEGDYVDGPAEIIWEGDKIFVKKKRVKVAEGSADKKQDAEDVDRPTSNPLPPQSVAFASYNSEQRSTAQELLEGVAQQVPNFGTEQDKAHCPFHLKTGACRFGTRCSRVHFYPDKSCTLLIKNMYNGPGLVWEQDEGLEKYISRNIKWRLKVLPLVEDGDKSSLFYEEVERCYEEFYEDVHTEFLKFGELVNFKVCKNGSYHLRGNVYVHYRSLESAILAYNTMNGRYFAGKQITCEFIGVTRWKVAICGEYMKSRLRTCSHGTACNFIHCFRNPGGDYEWADWDNPPPKYWIRKMAVLFGHSDESTYGKQMELRDFESPKDSDRKRTPRHGIDRRYHLRKSPHDEIEVHGSGSIWEDSYKKRDQRSSHSVRTDHSRRRKETSFLDKPERSEGNHKSKVHGYDGRHHPHGHDSSDDKSKEKDRESLDKRQKCEEKNNLEAHLRHKRNHRTKEELSSCQDGEAFSDKQEKPERKHKLKSHKQHTEEHRSFDQLSDYTNDRRNQSSSCSSEELYFRHSIDAEDRYDGRYCSNDSDSGREFLSQNRSRDKRQASERRMNRYKSRYHTGHTSHGSGRGGKKGKAMKLEANDGRSTSGEPPDRWEVKQRDSGGEDSDGHLSNGGSSHRKPSKSFEKYKHHREKRKHEVNNSGSDEVLDRRAARKKFSQSRTPTGHSANSEERRIQPKVHTP